ncbi:mechanosensitive ion channel [Candidatus Woesearchaeota archaeon]|nr:mechanosensitive ion channel [Candidatus Woesearchaeota archaeon]
MFHDKVFAGQSGGVLLLAVSVLVTVALLKLAFFFIRKRFEGKGDRAQAKEMVSIYKYSIVISVIIVLVVVFNNVFKDALASIGILAAGLAISLQKPILNVFGWLTIVLKKPYVIGDRVSIGASKGDVFEINIMHTSMSELQDDAPSGRMIAVPNEFVLSQPVTNFTKGTPYVWDNISVVIDQGSDEKEAAGILGKAVDRVVGRLMSSLSKKWTVVDGRKVDVRPETGVELVVVNGVSAIQLTSRYLCNVREKRSVRSRINELLLSYVKNSKSVRLK